MNAIADNSFTRTLKKLGPELETPRAILMVSAHWQTAGTFVTSTAEPKTIYDMSGFPDELYQVKYPAPGDPKLAAEIQQLVSSPQILLDEGSWGLDHGTWSVLVHLFPKANIPVLQLSLDRAASPQAHFELGQKLRTLRQQGILILGSGNVVHNLRKISWEETATPFSWAVEFSQWFEQQLAQRNFSALINDFRQTETGRLSVPTLEHYLPSLYILGAAEDSETAKLEFTEIQNGSIAMTSFSFGR